MNQNEMKITIIKWCVHWCEIYYIIVAPNQRIKINGKQWYGDEGGGLPENILKGDKEISVSIRVGKVITEFWILS